MTAFEWIVTVGLGVAVWQLVHINMKLGAMGHVLMDIEQIQKGASIELIRQGLPDGHPLRGVRYTGEQ